MVSEIFLCEILSFLVTKLPQRKKKKKKKKNQQQQQQQQQQQLQISLLIQLPPVILSLPLKFWMDYHSPKH